MNLYPCVVCGGEIETNDQGELIGQMCDGRFHDLYDRITALEQAAGHSAGHTVRLSRSQAVEAFIRHYYHDDPNDFGPIDAAHDCMLGSGKNEPSYHTCPGCAYLNAVEDAEKMVTAIYGPADTERTDA